MGFTQPSKELPQGLKMGGQFMIGIRIFYCTKCMEQIYIKNQRDATWQYVY